MYFPTLNTIYKWSQSTYLSSIFCLVAEMHAQCKAYLLVEVLACGRQAWQLFIEDIFFSAHAVIFHVLCPVQLPDVEIKHLQQRNWEILRCICIDAVEETTFKKCKVNLANLKYNLKWTYASIWICGIGSIIWEKENRLCQGRRSAKPGSSPRKWTTTYKWTCARSSSFQCTSQQLNIFKAGAIDWTGGSWEDCIEEAKERNQARVDVKKEAGRHAHWWRGVAGHSLCNVFTPLGITGAEKRKATTEAAERASRWLWIRRSNLQTNASGTQDGL